MAASALSAVSISSNLVIPLALILAYVPHTVKVVSIGQSKLLKGYNFNPRAGVSAAIAALEKKGDDAAVATARSAAFLLAKVNHVPEETLSAVGTAWVGSRLLYTWLYMTGDAKWKTSTRSAVWFSGLAMCGFVMYLACTQPTPAV